MTELQYAIKHGGLTPKRLLKKISRRGFGATVLGGLATLATSRLTGSPSGAAAEPDFTIAIIPDPQWLAQSCADNLGGYYSAMMTWIVDNRNMTFTSGRSSFDANIKAVIGVGDCLNSASVTTQNKNAETAWAILDRNGMAFLTPPGNHDYENNLPSSRSNLGTQFTTGYFSADYRSSIYGSGISLGNGDVAYWIGSYDRTGANTAVKFVISGVKMLILAMDFFAGNAAWSWAYDVMLANRDCECYITTHAWLTMNGTQFGRASAYGPNAYAMATPPYSNSAEEAWNSIGVRTWPNLRGIFSGHDISGGWYWQHRPIKAGPDGHTVHQLFANTQEIDHSCSASASLTTGAGQIASVFLLTRRLELGLLEGRMISTQSGDWFGAAPSSVGVPGESWSASETLLFSIPFNEPREEFPNPVRRRPLRNPATQR